MRKQNVAIRPCSQILNGIELEVSTLQQRKQTVLGQGNTWMLPCICS